VSAYWFKLKSFKLEGLDASPIQKIHARRKSLQTQAFDVVCEVVFEFVAASFSGAPLTLQVDFVAAGPAKRDRTAVGLL
jgi:hypothetical protein